MACCARFAAARPAEGLGCRHGLLQLPDLWPTPRPALRGPTLLRRRVGAAESDFRHLALQVKVCVIDTGANVLHQDLRSNIVQVWNRCGGGTEPAQALC